MLLLFALSLIAGCATSAEKVEHQFLESEMVVFVSDKYIGSKAHYIDDVVRTLQKHDFEITKYRAQANYDLEFGIYRRHVRIALMQGRESVTYVTSHSRGGSDYDSTVSYMVDNAVKQLDLALAQKLNE